MIVLGTTLAAFAMDRRDTWGAWLYTLEDMRELGHDVQPFVAIEVDGRGLAPFTPLLDRLREAHGEHWTFALDDGRVRVTTSNRLRHLTMGQNLVTEYATAHGATHLLFCAADCAPPADLVKLLEMRHPLVGPEVRTYCLSGPAVDGYDFPVQRHMLSAACVLIERSVFKRLRWRVDPDLGTTDDPSYELDARELLGVASYCRKDVSARHFPESIGAIESRGHDLRVYRG